MYMTNRLKVSEIREYLDGTKECSIADRDAFVRDLGKVLAMVSSDHRREQGHHLVAGEEEVADLSFATEALLLSRRSKTAGSNNKPVQVWPSALEAWMNAEVVAAGIAGATEYMNGRVFSPEDEEQLRHELTAIGVGAINVRLSSLENYS